MRGEKQGVGGMRNRPTGPAGLTSLMRPIKKEPRQGISPKGSMSPLRSEGNN